MDWFAGPLPEVLGIPAFWIVRLAKLLQLISGLYILIDILGEQRIESISLAMQRGLAETKLSSQLRRVGDVVQTSLSSSFGLPPLSYLRQTDRSEIHTLVLELTEVIATSFPFSRLGLLLSFAAGAVPALFVASNAGNGEPQVWPLLHAATAFGAIYFLIGVPGCFAALLLSTYAVAVTFRGAASVLRNLTQRILVVLQRKRLANLALILSFAFFILGSLIEIAAS